MKSFPYWLESRREPLEPALGAIEADAVVVGGGLAGLTAAQFLATRGVSVVVVEQGRCGEGATGRSSGFITPDSELQATQLLRRFGPERARFLWTSAADACEQIRKTLIDEAIECDFRAAGSLYVGIGRSGRSSVESEHESRERLGLRSALYDAGTLPEIFAAEGFEGGVHYDGTFSLTPYRYAVGLRDRLRARGVRVFENSRVLSVEASTVRCERSIIRARMVFVCADQWLSSIGGIRSAAYHAQTFLAATDPLPAATLRELFPIGDLLVWDSDLIYHYCRPTADRRLLLGGGLLRRTYTQPADPSVMLPSFRDYLQQHLPRLGDLPLPYVWHGLIGVTRDLLPVAGRDRRSGIFYAGCAAGLPWSVLAARCAVENAIDGKSALDPYFDPERVFTDLDILQPLLGKPLTFALSHAYAKGALHGTAPQVRRRTKSVVVAMLLFAGASLAFASRRTSGRKRRRRLLRFWR